MECANIHVTVRKNTGLVILHLCTGTTLLHYKDVVVCLETDSFSFDV